MGYNSEHIESLFIIGGGKIYESLIPYADEVILSHFLNEKKLPGYRYTILFSN